MSEHLRKHMHDGLQQKMRMEKKISAYEEQKIKSRERAIDQNILQGKMIGAGASSERVNEIIMRKEKDTALFGETSIIVDEEKVKHDLLTRELNAHGQELSEIEITTGGFYQHEVGIFEDSKYDEATGIVSFGKKGGHVQMLTPVIRTQWKDASQLTIRKIVEG